MIGVARSIAAAESLGHAAFVQADAQVHRFRERAYDRVISRTGSMFFAEPDAAFTNIAGAMTPGARLTLLTWQPPERNPWIGAFAQALLGTQPPAPAPGTPGPFSLSDPSLLRRLLTDNGFAEVDVEGLTAPMIYGTDVEDAHRFVLGLLGWMLDGRDESGRRGAEEALRVTLEQHLGPDGVAFPSATWLVTAHRTGN